MDLYFTVHVHQRLLESSRQVSLMLKQHLAFLHLSQGLERVLEKSTFVIHCHVRPSNFVIIT
jgi:hypothetical protein